MKKYYKDFTFNDFKELIVNNNVTSRKDLGKRFFGCYEQFLKLLSVEEQDELLPSKEYKHRYKHIKTLDDFRKFIIDNNVTSRKDFREGFPRCYNKFCKLLSIEEQEELLPSKELKYGHIKTLDDIRKFIIDNNVTSRKNFKKRFSGCYEKFLKLSIEEQDELLPTKVSKHRYERIKTLDDFRKFIIDNNVTSREDFKKRFFRCYRKFLELLSVDEQDKLLPVITSVGELFISDILLNKQLDFEQEIIFEDLIYKQHLRYDFRLKDSGILIEYHGSQHFNPSNNFYTEENIIRDKIKYEYAKQNNIPLLYFTNEVEEYKKYGYFTEVITDADILIERIKEIINKKELI